MNLLGKKFVGDMCHPCLLSFMAVFRPVFHLECEKIKSLDVTWKLYFVSLLHDIGGILYMEIKAF